MIKKSLFTFGIIFGIWSIILETKNISVTQHLWQENLAAAEIFLFDTNKVDNIIVGSSLARRLPTKNLPDFQNLSLSGQGVFDGLSLIKSKEKIPNRIFIEINVLARRENTEFLDNIASPLNSLKESIPALRADKQPLPSAIDFIHSKVTNKEISTKDRKVDGAVFKKLLERQEKSYSKPNDNKLMEKQVSLLKKYINYFESKGANVIFFELPVNPKLVNLSRANQNRNRIIVEFPDHDFIKLPPNTNLYTTVDGVHLTEEEAHMYMNYFKSELTKRQLK